MRKIILSVVLLVVSGCTSVMESIQSANTENILIQTPRVEGAECEVTDDMGRKWRLWETPGTVAVKNGHPPLVIICTKKNFKKSVLTIDEHKKEILTIDGKRVDLSIYNQFPTKIPRLIPAAIKETVGFAQDPTGSVSTQYPNQIVVWMEPKQWESEDQMREWAFDREIQNRADLISEEEYKLTEEQRKAKRREDGKRREAKINDTINKTKEALRAGAKKGFTNTTKVLNPQPIIDGVVDSGRKISLDKTRDRYKKASDSMVEKSSDTNSRAIKALGGDALDKAKDVGKSVNPGTAVDFLNKRNDVREKTRDSREKEEDDEYGEDNSFSKSTMPNKLPANIDKNAPQDLYERRYDEKGMRIAPK